jgi:mono/diheme cytochrome c family protein
MFVAKMRRRCYVALMTAAEGAMSKPDLVAHGRSVHMLQIIVASLFLAASAPALAQSGGTAEGEAIYRARCVGCHGSGATRAPDLATLRAMSPDSVLTALRSGSMSTQAQGLSTAQLDNLSRFVAGAAGPDTA